MPYYGNDSNNIETGSNWFSMYGGDGNDRLNDTANNVGEDNYIDGGRGHDYLYFLNGAFGEINGGHGNDSVFGSSGGDSLYGGEGNDFVSGDAGGDDIYGGGGTDGLYGGNGVDYIYGGEGNDTNVTFQSAAFDTAVNNLLTNRTGGLYGDAGNDVLYGGRGSDFLSGGADNDTLYGGGQNDILNGDAGDDEMSGDGGDDVLNGGEGADLLEGGRGADILNGGLGKDTLYGGQGPDIFLFDVAPGNANFDLVKDFKRKEDKIHLDDAIYSSIGPKLAKKEFYVGKKAKDGKDFIIYNKKNGKLFYDEDGKGGVGQKLIAQFDKNTDLSHKDFLIV